MHQAVNTNVGALFKPTSQSMLTRIHPIAEARIFREQRGESVSSGILPYGGQVTGISQVWSGSVAGV